MSNAVEVENVTLHFPRSKGMIQSIVNIFKSNDKGGKGSFTALDQINLTISRGEVIGVIGRNGSGKSTLLRVIAGIYQPDQGEVRTLAKISLLAGVSVGLNGNLTGRENVHLYGSILGNSEQEMDSKMGDILDFSELGEFIEQPLRTYSSGMKARLGIAIASAIEPEILLIDEVLGVGDPQFREKSKARILNLVENSGTVVIVSHSFGLMKEICNRLILVNKGKIEMIGEPEEVIKRYYNLEE
jgi:ABC-type polysaccharide/polyol phosphate transport system ATPase subunit